jgi:lipoate-protein ligase A
MVCILAVQKSTPQNRCTVRCIIDHTTDPFTNLAAEEYLLTGQKDSVFRLWRNAPAIIVGRNQNTLSEINKDYVVERNIPVVRRLSGGGAVFHDLGNINYTFVDSYTSGMDTSEAFARFTKPILDMLSRLGIHATLEGRNDLVINGRKFSGNAIARHKNRILMHGTLLFSASMEDLSQALRIKERDNKRGVASHPSRVCNLSEFLPSDITPIRFMELLKKHISEQMQNSFEDKPFLPEELSAIERLSNEKYRTYAWNYGRGCKWEHIRKKRFEGGNVEVCFKTSDGILQNVNIYGDYFFYAPTEDIEKALKGCPLNREDMAKRLTPFVWDDYFRHISPEELIDLFF